MIFLEESVSLHQRASCCTAKSFSRYRAQWTISQLEWQASKHCQFLDKKNCMGVWWMEIEKKEITAAEKYCSKNKTNAACRCLLLSSQVHGKGLQQTFVSIIHYLTVWELFHVIYRIHICKDWRNDFLKQGYGWACHQQSSANEFKNFFKDYYFSLIETCPHFPQVIWKALSLKS